MNINRVYFITVFIFNTWMCAAGEKPGAAIPWTTYEAEYMKTNGTILGPQYAPFRVETESSGQRCVKLSSRGRYVEFTASVKANSIVIRYSLPDRQDGGGEKAMLGIYKNGGLIKRVAVSSRYSRLYGLYPFTNDPAAGKPRNFYDEVSMKGLKIMKGDVIRIQYERPNGDDADYCIIDLVDLENIDPPLNAPSNSLSLTDKRFTGSNGTGDYTNALRKCIALAVKSGKIVWIPAGIYKITGDIILPPDVTVQGAGMWYTTLAGDKTLYADANRRVRLIGDGGNIHLADFSIKGKLDYRNDNEPNDGIVGSFGTNSTISRVWIEHTKVGMWIENSKHLLVKDCRLRNTIADGINFCVGVTQSTIENCTARGTGDDCFAVWPASFAEQKYIPGQNRIIHCTAQLPFLANGIALYGGKSNQVTDCRLQDISQGSAILISTTFQTADAGKGINNNFSGTTRIEHCDIKYSGGFDHTWGWRAAVQICLDTRSISGIEMKDIRIDSSLSDGLSVIARNEGGKTGILSNTVLEDVEISTYGIGVRNRHGLWIAKDAHGSLTLVRPAVSEIKNDSEYFTVKSRQE